MKDGREYVSRVEPYCVKRTRRIIPPVHGSNQYKWYPRDYLAGRWVEVTEEAYIGGHYRRKALYRKLLSALKF